MKKNQETEINKTVKTYDLDSNNLEKIRNSLLMNRKAPQFLDLQTKGRRRIGTVLKMVNLRKKGFTE
jgi:hypothetical protein